MWRVIADFADLADGGYIYRAGDNYPRAGKPSPARVKELSGRNNKRGAPLIERAEKPEEEKPRRTRKKADE